jgi:FkbM family methyltransferase
MKKTYAEFETDHIIWENYFLNKVGVMVEVGCADPIIYSMSKLFRDKGWRCIGVEPNPFFTNKHRMLGNEVYEYAVSTQNATDVDFFMVNDYGHGHTMTYESFSALKIHEGYIEKHSMPQNIEVIKVKTKTLQDILEQDAKIDHIDFLSVDVEGYELDVIRSLDLTKYKPSVIVLENYLYDANYNTFMQELGYALIQTIEYNYIYGRI